MNWILVEILVVVFIGVHDESKMSKIAGENI